MDQTSESEKSLQKQKYEEIIEILLSAGYFRARIASLNEFDKVVGGLCWCITSSGEDVDVDILFQENSTIGQRISISESIVKALRKMNCPSPLQANQIQGGVGGSDYSAIYPVIVWLIKKFFERRDKRDAQSRLFSILQFSKNFQFPNEAKIGDGISSDLITILARNKAQRVYRRRGMKKEAEFTRVRSCLLEYGETFVSNPEEEASGKGTIGGAKGDSIVFRIPTTDGVPIGSMQPIVGEMSRITIQDSAPGRSGGEIEGGGGGGAGGGTAGSGGGGVVGTGVTVGGVVGVGKAGSGAGVGLASGKGKASDSGLSGFEKKLAQAAKEAEREQQLLQQQAGQEEKELKKQMKQLGEDVVLVSGIQIGAIVGLGSSEIGVAAAAFQADLEESQKQLESNLANGRLGQLAAFKRQKQNLVNQQAELETKSAELRTSVDSLNQKLKILEEERDEALSYQQQLQAQILKLKGIESSSNQQKELTTLKNLVTLNESLKGQEASFKASCKAQLQDLNARIAALDAADEGSAEENQKLKDIEDMHAKVLLKYQKLRQLLAETNLEVSTTSRTIDDVPTRTELIQYERRFAELYQQVNWKFGETKKYFDMYNSQETVLSFIQKEIKLLNSISENFPAAMKSPAQKTEFLQQFQLIVKGVEDSLRRQERDHSLKSAEVDQIKTHYQNLVDEQRSYFKAVRDFQEECNKNEWLVEKLEQLTKS